MENASKALIMAGEILIGIIILSIGAYFVMNVSRVPDAYGARMTQQEIDKFNTYFTKFVGREDITPQEIVSAVYYAQEFNDKMGKKTITVVVSQDAAVTTKEPDWLSNQTRRKDWEEVLTTFITKRALYVEDYMENGENKKRLKPYKYRCVINDNDRTEDGLVSRIIFNIVT